MSSQRVTLAAVAEAAGVSISTASRALAGAGTMSRLTRLRVIENADRLGYSRLDEKRGRPRTGSGLIDLVLGNFDDPWADEVTAGTRIAAAENGYDLVLTIERDEVEDDWPARVRARGSAGVVLGIISPTIRQLDALEHAGIPVVLLDPRSDPPRPMATVGTTDAAGGAEAARHLYERGARRFVVVAGTPRYRFGRARVEGFVSEIRRLDPAAPIDLIDSEWTREGAHVAVRDVLVSDALGVFAVSDALALGVLDAAEVQGRRVPNDLLVMGFDDVPAARWVRPTLTTVRQPLREMSARAVELVDERARGGPLTRERVELPTTLRVRASTTI